MKKLILILSLSFVCLNVNSQTDTLNSEQKEFMDRPVIRTGIDTAAYKDYSTCMTCGEQWSTTNQVNQYATGQSKSQQRTLHENAMATQTANSGKRFLRAVGATVVGIFVAAVTMSIITKTNQSANALFH